MNPKTYHVGLLRKNDRVIVQLRADRDCLDCETWRYLGEREITKAKARQHKAGILAGINSQFNTSFTRITID